MSTILRQISYFSKLLLFFIYILLITLNFIHIFRLKDTDIDYSASNLGFLIVTTTICLILLYNDLMIGIRGLFYKRTTKLKIFIFNSGYLPVTFMEFCFD